MASTESPDQNATGLLANSPDALRYDGQTDDPHEVAGMLAALVPMGARVLDVGCGTGSVSCILIKTRGARLIGVEPDAERAAVARERGIEVHQGTLNPELLCALGVFDVILLADVLEHLSDPSALLQMVRKGLNEGGAVLASIPNVAHWSVRIDLLCGRFDYQDCGIRDATHLRWFTARTVRTLFESNNFQVVTLHHTAGVTLPEYFARRPWRWLPRCFRDPLVRALARWWPSLFGCQHIVRAVP